MMVVDLVPGGLGPAGGITLTGDDGNIEASFSFGDDGSEASLNFETGGDDISSRASLSFGIADWLNGDIS
jgi:hypothetical protein